MGGDDPWTLQPRANEFVELNGFVMKSVEVLYFAAAREKTGLSQEYFRWSAGLTLAALIDRVLANHPALRPFMTYMRLAVDEEFVSEFSMVLVSGQTIAFIPPVSGG